MAEIDIEVAFALTEKQRIIGLRVPLGTTASQAVALADLPSHFPELPADVFSAPDLGLFGKRLRAPEAHRLRAGDRVEVYRALIIDPKAARLARANTRR